jgi:hypothetical protein
VDLPPNGDLRATTRARVAISVLGAIFLKKIERQSGRQRDPAGILYI